MVLVLLADGFEEVEAFFPVDLLRRAGLTVKTVGISGKFATGSHGIRVECDILPEEIDYKDIEAVILPGGLPGTEYLDASPVTNKVLDAVLRRGGHVGAICAAPSILGRRGLLKNKRATCYPGFERELFGADRTRNDAVSTDGNITTARSVGVAKEFAKELVRVLAGEEKMREISETIAE